MLQVDENQNFIALWLTDKKPKKVLVLTRYQRLDRNLKILAKRYPDLDKGNILLADTLIFDDKGKPHCIFYPTKDEWTVVNKKEWNIEKRYTKYKGGARKFLNWYDKQ